LLKDEYDDDTYSYFIDKEPCLIFFDSILFKGVQMTTFYIGLLEEAKPSERKDKTTGAITMQTQLTVTFQSIDADEFLVKSTENIMLDINLLGDMQQAKGKYIAVPYQTINTKSGTYTFPDDKLKVEIFDKDPFAFGEKKDTKKVA
jgi:hypothetical protein